MLFFGSTLNLAAALFASYLASYHAVQAQATVAITPNASLAQAWGVVSQILPPSFAGMGIEPSNLFSYTGGNTVNQFTMNLMHTLANYTGVPPHLRIGGNAQDYMIYDSTYTSCGIQGNANAQGQGAIAWDSQIVGPCYFSALNRFPAGTPITFGLNLAYNAPDWPQRITAMADAARSQLQSAELVSFEIGNEPDLYLSNAFRTGAWGSQVYMQQWLQRAAAVYQQVLKPNNITSDFFEPTATANTIGNSFQIDIIANTTDVLKPAANQPTGQNNTYISTWNQHDYYYYIGVSTAPLTMDILMDLSTTYAQFSEWHQQVQQAFATGHPYVLREMASSGPNGYATISNAFGASLWTLNFFLYAASLNISSVEIHMTVASTAAPWIPVRSQGVPAHVRPSYYAFAAMDQIIGGGCGTRVAPITIGSFPTGYDSGRLTAYASYVGNNIASVILLNTRLVNATSPTKNSVNWTVHLPSLSGRTLFLSYLTNSGADSLFNTTWNGMSYEQDSTGMPTNLNQAAQTVVVATDGTATIPVRDTEAVIANVDSQIGTGPNAVHNETACKALASSGAVPSEPLNPPAASTTLSANHNPTSGPDVFRPGGSPSSTSSSSSAMAAAATPPPTRKVLEVAALIGGVAAVLA